MNFSRLNDANRFLLVKVTFTLYVQVLESETRRVEIVVSPASTGRTRGPCSPAPWSRRWGA